MSGTERESDEEVLSGGRGTPRWLHRLAAAVAVALIVGVLIDTVANSQHSPARPSATPAPSSRGVPVPPLPLRAASVLGATGTPLRLPDRSAPIEIVVKGDESWLLQARRLSTFTTDTHYVTRALPTVLPADAHLLLDAAAHRIWVVAAGLASSMIWAFDASDLAPLSAVRWASRIDGAAPLGRTLFLTSRSGVYHLGPGAPRPVAVPGTAGVSGPLTADPLRSRVLVVRSGARAEIVAIQASGRVSRTRLRTGITPGSLVVTSSGQLWLAGATARGTVGLHLDPRRSDRVVGSALPGVRILAAGSDDLLAAGGDGILHCISGTDGKQLEFWPLRVAAATSTLRAAYVIVRGAVVPLVLRGSCTG